MVFKWHIQNTIMPAKPIERIHCFLFRGGKKSLKENDDKKASHIILHGTEQSGRLSFLKNPALKMA